MRGRDEMLRALQVEFGRTRERLNTAETECLAAQHAAQRAESGRRDAEAERDETNEKLQLCMLEVRARTERADYLNAQLAAARAEMRALDNQLVIHSNQLALTKQSNSQLADGATAKASELGAAQTALHAKEERLDATQLALAGARAESAKLSEEAARLRAQLAEALAGKRLTEQQLAHMQTTVAFAKQDQATAKRNEEAAAALAEDERLMRARHEGSIAPLRAALKEKEEALKEAEDEQLGAQLLAERLAVADAQHVADEEASELAGRKVAAAEARAANAEGRLAGLSTELGRRDARVAAIKHSLNAANEELALLRASKQLLAARHELGHELAKQRDATASEGEALQAAIAASFSRHREAAAVGAAIETIGSADGDGGAAAAIATAGAAAAARGSASAREAAIEAAQAELVVLEEAKAATVREQQRAAAELEATTRSSTRRAAPPPPRRRARRSRTSTRSCCWSRCCSTTGATPRTSRRRAVRRGRRQARPRRGVASYVHLRMSGGEQLSASAADNDGEVIRLYFLPWLISRIPQDPSLYVRSRSAHFVSLLDDAGVEGAAGAAHPEVADDRDDTPRDGKAAGDLARRAKAKHRGADEEQQRARAERVVQEPKVICNPLTRPERRESEKDRLEREVAADDEGKEIEVPEDADEREDDDRGAGDAGEQRADGEPPVHVDRRPPAIRQ